IAGQFARSLILPAPLTPAITFVRSHHQHRRQRRSRPTSWTAIGPRRIPWGQRLDHLTVTGARLAERELPSTAARRSRRARSAAIRQHPLSNMNAGPCVPKRSFIVPMSVGPRNPPTFAILGTSATPAAAAEPVRKRVGVDQNGPYAAQCPIGTSASDKSPNLRPGRKAQPRKPAPMIANGIATCKGRSSVRSECVLFNSIKMIVIALIRAKMTPTPKLLLPVSDLMTSGDQNEYP